MNKTKERLIDITLMILALSLFCFAGYLYLSDYPIRQLLLPIDTAGQQEIVAQLFSKKGPIRRKISRNLEFKDLEEKSDLYNLDTIITGPESTGIIIFKNGGTIELAPKTMIKLEFATNFTFSGISRSQTVAVVAGEVSGKTEGNQILLKSKDKTVALSKNKNNDSLQVSLSVPTPLPSQFETQQTAPSEIKPIEKKTAEITLLSPVNQSKIRLEEGLLVPEKKVTFQWKINPPTMQATFNIQRQSVTIFSKPITGDQNGNGSLTMILKAPGLYTWTIVPKDPLAILLTQNQSVFEFEKNFIGLTALQPLIAGETRNSNSYTGATAKNFEITLRWKPYPNTRVYKLSLFKKIGDAEPLFEKSIDGTEYVLNKSKIFSGQIYYTVSTEVKNGFIASTGFLPFRFEFNPPNPVLPEDHAIISQTELVGGKNEVIFTWGRTDFTNNYEIEIANSEDFSKVLLKKKVSENFFILKNPPSGSFWWRIRSLSGDVLSAPSSSRVVVVRK